MKNHILITGGAGYVGNRVARLLFHKGFSVRVIDTASPIDRYTDFPKQIEFFRGDLRDKQSLLNALDGISLVVHLAASIGSMSYMDAYPADILAANAAIDSVLYPALVSAGVKKILYSSSSMVFQHPLRFPYHESDFSSVALPTNVYGFSKLLGEYFCRSFHEQYNLDYVIVRYHNIYGPGEIAKPSRLFFDDKVVGKQNENENKLNNELGAGYIHVLPALLEKVLGGQYPLELLGGDDASRPFTYIDDAVEATWMLIESFLASNVKVVNTDFNIGPRQSTKILDLAELIWKLYGDSRPFAYIVSKVKTTTAKKREMDPRKIRDAIGWEPKISLDDGIRRTGEWMKRIRGEEILARSKLEDEITT